MVKSIKVMLLPNNKQKTKMFQCAGSARFAYNWAIAKQQENYANGLNFIQENELRKEFTKIKKTEKYSWLNDISNNVTKQAIKDSCIAYINFFNKKSETPKFKRKNKTIPKFYQDTNNIKFNSTHVKLEKLTTSKKQNKQKMNWIKLAEKNRIPFGDNVKYINPRVSFDGLNWWISVGIEFKDIIYNNKEKTEGIGIDLGIKDFVICSNNNTYPNINKTKNILKIEKKKNRIQRKIDKKYLKNKKGESYCKTKNIIKLEKELLKVYQRLTNIRQNYQYKIISDIIKQNPSFITIENLNIAGMMKNKHLSKSVKDQSFYNFTRKIQYKCEWNGIELRKVSRFFPSSKLCCVCGNIKKDLKLSDRIYICNLCGNQIDRDYQASLNLRDAKEYVVIVN